jgi:hypothetical protein
VSIVVNPRAPKTFSLRVRMPNRQGSGLYPATPRVEGAESIRVNGTAAKPAVDKGYAVITRLWKAGDRVDLVLPMRVQRVRAIDKIAATRGRVALRYGPLVYNIEKADQDITKVLSPDSALITEWRGDLLGGVMVIKGTFADGSPMLAIPNYARMNREPSAPAASQTGADGAVRPVPGPPTSIVWIREA